MSSNFDSSTSENPPVILTPGFQDDARKVSWMAAYLQANGLRPVIISPQPSDASVGIDRLAVKLAEEIERQLGPNQPIDFFGFSMGGLIGRYYLQRLGGDKRIRRFITMATPHRGTWTARIMPIRPALIQMYPGSEFLVELNKDISILFQVDFMAFWTPFDLSVTPASNCYIPSLPATRIFSPFHATLLHDPIAIRAVTRTLMAPERATA
jgi:triacylglycerol lipase